MKKRLRAGMLLLGPLDALAGPHAQLLARIATLAQAQGSPLWLVGGGVRDLLLGLPLSRDVDLAIEGDAVALAHTLATAIGGRVTAQHAAFGTATVVLAVEPPLTLDLAATRREHYPQPATLPQVQPASIAEDLRRRDFSINALALRLTVHDNLLHGSQLLDPFDGQRDLAAGMLRVLHAQSFADDPTRMLRGLRLAVRLGMQFAPETANLLAAAMAAGMLEATTPDRIRGELCLTLEEPDPGAVLRQAHARGMLPHIYPPLERLAAQPQATPCDEHTDPLVQAGLLTYDLSRAEREALIARYRLPGAAARLLRDVATLRERRADLRRPELRNSELDSLLRDAVVSAVHVIRCAEADTLGTRIQHYLTNLRGVVPLLDGHALRELGIAPGPRMGALLTGLRAARLDGLLHSRADEEHWIQQQSADPSA